MIYAMDTMDGHDLVQLSRPAMRWVSYIKDTRYIRDKNIFKITLSSSQSSITRLNRQCNVIDFNINHYIAL